MGESQMTSANETALTPVEPVPAVCAPSHKTLNRDPHTGAFTKVDITHEQAFELYCELPDMPLRAFARELNERGIKISNALVGRWSAKYRWQHRRSALRDEGPVGLLTVQDRIARLATLSDQWSEETVNGLAVQIMETVSGNLGHIEIRTPEDAHAMIDLAQKLAVLSDAIVPPRACDRDRRDFGEWLEEFKAMTGARQHRKKQPPFEIGSFRDHVREGGDVPD